MVGLLVKQEKLKKRQNKKFGKAKKRFSMSKKTKNTILCTTEKDAREWKKRQNKQIGKAIKKKSTTNKKAKNYFLSTNEKDTRECTLLVLLLYSCAKKEEIQELSCLRGERDLNQFKTNKSFKKQQRKRAQKVSADKKLKKLSKVCEADALNTEKIAFRELDEFSQEENGVVGKFKQEAVKDGVTLLETGFNEKKKSVHFANEKYVINRREFSAALSATSFAHEFEKEKLLSEKDNHEVKEVEKKEKDDSSEPGLSDADDIFHYQSFDVRPHSWTVCTLDTVTHTAIPQNLSVVGSIPWSWLREEKWRLHTFAKYPSNSAKSALLLAEAGFAYIGSGKSLDDVVICYFCQKSKRGWREDENIKETHAGLDQGCPMVTGVECGNIPLIAPTNLSFPLHNSQPQRVPEAHKYSHDVIETDCVPGAGQAPSVAQGHQNYSASTLKQRRKPVQTSTVMPPPPAGPAPAVTPGQVVIDTVSPNHPSDESGPATLVTSSNNALTFPAQNPATASVAQRGGARQPHNQGAAAARQPAKPSQQVSGNSQQAGSRVSGGTSEQGRTSGSRVSNAAPSTATTAPPPATTTNSSSNPTPAPGQGGSSTADSSSAPANSPAAPATPANPPAAPQNPTYLELGIITERPKRYEYALGAKRLETFGDWPAGHHLRKEDLADAGFYYAGYGDCARCFYCGGGLRNWEMEDDVWVEHARWFPKCAFIRQKLGQVFIDTVALLGRTHEKISFPMVTDEMRIHPSAFQIDSKDTPLKHDPSVVAVREMGYRDADILPAAVALKESTQILSADILFNALEEKGAPRNHTDAVLAASSDIKQDEEALDTLKEANNNLRLQTLCKICMDKEVAVVFLPCGHLVCCTECASAMKDCPVCRKQVKGIVRAFMG